MELLACPDCGRPHSDATTCEDARELAIIQPCEMCGSKVEGHACREVLRQHLNQLAKNLGLKATDPAKIERIEQATAQELSGWIQKLLTKHGSGRRMCRDCSATVTWVEHANGKKCPYNRWGASHFGDCPRYRRQA